MPGPVVQGVNGSGAARALTSQAPAGPAAIEPPQELLPLLAEGTIRLILMSSGELLIARLRHTSDADGAPAFQLLRPLKVTAQPLGCDQQHPDWTLSPFLEGVTSQQSLVVFKSAVASLLEPLPELLHHYAAQTQQEAPMAPSPLDRLKQAFEDFTTSLESSTAA
ncbi:MAG: DUF6561 domain-containing protein [Synechococcus sp.]|nr:DUF6561 domain-containing protein [Synechococcus sp.]